MIFSQLTIISFITMTFCSDADRSLELFLNTKVTQSSKLHITSILLFQWFPNELKFVADKKKIKKKALQQHHWSKCWRSWPEEGSKWGKQAQLQINANYSCPFHDIVTKCSVTSIRNNVVRYSETETAFYAFCNQFWNCVKNRKVRWKVQSGYTYLLQ